ARLHRVLEPARKKCERLAAGVGLGEARSHVLLPQLGDVHGPRILRLRRSASPRSPTARVDHGGRQRMLSLEPQAIYVTHFGQVRDVRRLGAGLLRPIDAHADLALKYADSGALCRGYLTLGVRDFVLARGLKLDIELDAQG